MIFPYFSLLFNLFTCFKLILCFILLLLEYIIDILAFEHRISHFIIYVLCQLNIISKYPKAKNNIETKKTNYIFYQITKNSMIIVKKQD